MSEVTVSDLAKQVKINVEKLLVQLNEAGIAVADENATVTTKEKAQLLNYLKSLHGKKATDKPMISLKKISVSVAESNAPAVPVKRALAKTTDKKPAETAAEAKPAPKVSALDIAKKLAEEKRRQQGDEMRESAEESRIKQESIRKQREVEDALSKKKKLEESVRKKEQAEAQRLAQREQAVAQQRLDEEKRKDDEKNKTERQKQLAKEAEENAQKELVKQQAREKDNATHQAEDEQRRRVVEEEIARQDFVEALGKSKFRENRKEIKKTTKKLTTRVSLNNKHTFERPTEKVVTEVTLPETLTVGELAQKMNRKAPDLIKELMKMGSMMTINQVLDRDTAALLLEEMGHAYTFINENAAEESLLANVDAKLIDVQSRPPVVTIMGHVDHGKTSLLDYIRRTRVASGESGGITQHIGAYHVETNNGIVTFLDTPGHAAFTAMRARGAQLTDIVVVVVAADDGVMPQTVEAIQHARAGKVPIIIAVNKMDKPEADPEKIKGELTQHEIVSEDWGGEVIFAYVSAKSGDGIDDLLEKILLQAEVLELTAPAKGPAKGMIIEAKVDKGRGVVASVLIQKGELKKGDFVLSGQEYGRIRAISDENGNPLQTAGPSIPVEILGLSGAPMAGDELICVENERVAKDLAHQRQVKAKDARIAKQQKSKLDNLFAGVGGVKAEEVNILLKADVQGSAEALRDSLMKLSTDEVVVKVIASSVGGITETDVNLAIASNAIILGFNVRAEGGAKKLVEAEAVDMRYYSVIYDAIDDVKQAMLGKLAPEFREEIVGIAEVREVFRASKLGEVAGSIITEGFVKRSNPIRVLRDNVVVFEGELESLRRFKDDVNEVRAGTECGIGVKGYNNIRAGDLIECYERREVARQL